jgi:hypothetical protein
MAYTEKFTKLKDFNPEQLHDELAQLGLPSDFTVWFMGFEEGGDDKVTPTDFTNPRVVVKTPMTEPVAIVNAADKGEVHVLSGTKLTAQQVSDVDGALDVHNATTKTTLQLTTEQKDTDLASLRTKIKNTSVSTADLALLARLLLNALD